MCTVVAAWGFRDDVGVGLRWDPAGSSLRAEDVLAGRMVRVEGHIAASGVLAGVIRSEGITGAVAAPISLGGRVWGMLVAAWRTAALPFETEARLSEFTEIAGIAIASAESRAELTASRARVVAAADDTRRRIERDLHDGTQQQLLSLVLSLRALELKVPAELDEIREDVSQTATR